MENKPAEEFSQEEEIFALPEESLPQEELPFQNEEDFSQEEKSIAFWILQKGIALSPQQSLRFLKAAENNQCTQEIIDALTVKILFDKNITTEQIGDLSYELPTISNEEIMSYLNQAIQTAKSRLELWREMPRDTNARFFYSNLKRVDWSQDE